MKLNLKVKICPTCLAQRSWQRRKTPFHFESQAHSSAWKPSYPSLISNRNDRTDLAELWNGQRSVSNESIVGVEAVLVWHCSLQKLRICDHVAVVLEKQRTLKG